MIGVDTNILVRATLEDSPKESAIAQKLLQKMTSEKNLFISSYAILEMVWVLKVCGIAKEVICESVLDLVDSPGVVVGNREVIVKALERFIKGKADFGDYIILAEGETCDAPQLASFDKKFCKDSKQCVSPNELI